MSNQVSYSLFGLSHRQVPAVRFNTFIHFLSFFPATEEMRNKPKNPKNTIMNHME